MKRYLEILRLVWPLALGMVNNAVMQFVDGVFLARESLESLEASLPASMLAILVMGFFQSVVAYSGTFVAQYHGAGDSRGIRMSYRAGLVITLAAGILAIAVIPLGLMVAPFMSENSAVVARASSYYAIVSVGAIALCGQMAASSYFTGRGKTRLVFWVNVLGNAVNIALDPILIFGFCGCPRLGMAGAAYATVAAMFVQWGVLAWCAERDLRRLPGGGAADVPRKTADSGKLEKTSLRSVMMAALRGQAEHSSTIRTKNNRFMAVSPRPEASGSCGSRPRLRRRG